MKHQTFAILICMVLLLSVTVAHSGEYATTASGKRVYLNDDGTWENAEIKTVKDTGFVADGFKGFPWGASLKDMQKIFFLQYRDEMDAVKQYRTSIDSLAGLPIQTCSFGYLDNLFYSVTIMIEGNIQCKKMLEALKSVYGEPVDNRMGNYSWDSEVTKRSFVVLIGTGVIIMKSKMIEASHVKNSVNNPAQDF